MEEKVLVATVCANVPVRQPEDYSLKIVWFSEHMRSLPVSFMYC